MKIYTLGTSHGACEKGHFCSATLIETEGGYYLVDCGAPVEGLLTNMDIAVSDLRAVFITHMHDDHAGNLTSIIKRFSSYQDKNSVRIFLPEQAAIDALTAWSKALHQDFRGRVSLELINEGAFYADGNLSVYAHPTDHIHGFPTYAFEMECGEKRIFMSGDVTSDLHDFPKVLTHKDFDAVLFELTHYPSNEHFDTLNSIRARHLIFNHLSGWNVRRIAPYLDKFGMKTDIAEDGNIYEV